MTKCTFHKYGPSGTIQNHDGLCVLAINIITEKIYLILWFWFVLLAFWTALFLCFRAAMLASRWEKFTKIRCEDVCGKFSEKASKPFPIDHYLIVEL